MFHKERCGDFCLNEMPDRSHKVRVSNCSFTSGGFGKKSPPHLEVYKEMCEARRGECSLVVAADGMGRCRRVLLDNRRHLRQTRGGQRYLIRAKKILTP